ncbi:MAG: hypothetical protein LC624_11355 [Halobacteriales archaeon]|nr:hypothetical protein [Halobacteriales archaeon]
MRAMTMAASGAMLLAMLLPAVLAGPLGEEVADRCFELDPPDEAPCEVAEGVFGGLERPGASFGDFRGDEAVALEAANFYFSPKVSVMHDQQWVVWENGNPPGGNRHSVASSDWGCDATHALGDCQAVLPVAGLAFGGGRAFKATAPLQPGGTFALYVDIASMDPDAYVQLQDGSYLITYHCYIHGAAQMQGQLIVTDVEGPN